MNTITKTVSKKKAEKRNLYIRIPEESKEALRTLARASRMTMESYANAVLEDAIKHKDVFEFTKIRR